MKSTKYILIIGLGLILFACGQDYKESNSYTENKELVPASTPDPNQIRYVENTIAVGEKVFKKNCIGCHCGPGANVEPPYSCKLQYVFEGLTLDSLTHVIAFVRNSSKTKKSSRKNPFLTTEENRDNYTHEFEKTLPDSLIKTVVEYLWIGYKRTK